MTREEIDQENEKIKIRWWKSLPKIVKFNTLLYLFARETDFEKRMDYLEVHKFYGYGFMVSDLPEFIQKMSPRDLKYEAYELAGKLGELPRDEIA